MNYNMLILLGNLTRDAELKYLPSNTPLCEFGLAVNRKFKYSDGEQGEEVLFVDCVAFGKAAETLHRYVGKGDPILISGRLKFNRWQDKDGNNRSKHSVIVEGFQFIGSKSDDSRPARHAERAPQSQTAPPVPDVMDDDDITF